MLRIPAIVAFVQSRATSFHASLVHEGSELQVMAAPDGGEPVSREHNGHLWKGWTDGTTTWKNIRVPWRADTDPEYVDREMTWSLDDHAKACGASGWNWRDRQSEWFGFDVDSVTNHAANALTVSEMDDLRRAVEQIPWVTVARSRSGKGLHLFVQLDKPIATKTHNEHAALAHVILGLMSAMSGADLHGEVDCYGRIMWIWHRERGESAFEVLRPGERLVADRVPPASEQVLDSLRRKKRRPMHPGDRADEKDFEGVVRLLKREPLDGEHKRLLVWFASQDAKTMWSWNPELWMFQGHTTDLARAHAELGLRGIFSTVSTGKDRPDQNCFAVPVAGGGWQVRRFGKSAGETAAWTTDRSGWTRCDLNLAVTLDLAARVHGGVKADGRWVFDTLDSCVKALRALGSAIDPVALGLFLARGAELTEGSGKIVASFAAQKGDPRPTGPWVTDRSGKRWLHEFQYQRPRTTAEAPDDEIRAVVSGETLWSFCAKTGDGRWTFMSKSDAITFLKSASDPTTAERMASLAIRSPWRLVNKPFQDEYPGGREWNKNGARLAFEPKQGPHPTWDKMLDHLGQALDEGVAANDWCRRNAISQGRDYLLLWCACLFKEPRSSLPYLFLHSSAQMTGKSSLHEALQLLFKDGKGFVRAKDALTSSSGFNGGLSGAVLCVVEEVDLGKNREAYNRIKDWTLGLQIEIRALYENPRTEPNYTHWIQCANEATACPVKMGDTRITMLQVPPLTDMESRKNWSRNLEVEGPAFLHTMLFGTEIPESDERLRIPALMTSSKADQAEGNMTPVQAFLKERLEDCPGAAIPWAEFWKEFVPFLELAERPHWPQARVRAGLPAEYPRGKYGTRNDTHIGNVKWRGSDAKPGELLQRVGERLRQVGQHATELKEPRGEPLTEEGFNAAAA